MANNNNYFNHHNHNGNTNQYANAPNHHTFTNYPNNCNSHGWPNNCNTHIANANDRCNCPDCHTDCHTNICHIDNCHSDTHSCFSRNPYAHNATSRNHHQTAHIYPSISIAHRYPNAKSTCCCCRPKTTGPTAAAAIVSCSTPPVRVRCRRYRSTSLLWSMLAIVWLSSHALLIGSYGKSVGRRVPATTHAIDDVDDDDSASVQRTMTMHAKHRHWNGSGGGGGVDGVDVGVDDDDDDFGNQKYNGAEQQGRKTKLKTKRKHRKVGDDMRSSTPVTQQHLATHSISNDRTHGRHSYRYAGNDYRSHRTNSIMNDGGDGGGGGDGDGGSFKTTLPTTTTPKRTHSEHNSRQSLLANIGCPNCNYKIELSISISPSLSSLLSSSSSSSSSSSLTSPPSVTSASPPSIAFAVPTRLLRSSLPSTSPPTRSPPPPPPTPSPSPYVPPHQQQQQQRSLPPPPSKDEIRLEAIKFQILSKLGMQSKPNITHDMSKKIVMDTLLRAEEHTTTNVRHRFHATSARLRPNRTTDHHYRPHLDYSTGNSINDYTYNTNANDNMYMLSSADDGDDVDVVAPKVAVTIESDANDEQQNDGGQSDDFYGTTTEIISFAEKGEWLNHHRLIEFSASDQRAAGNDLHVRNAFMWVKIDRRRHHAGNGSATNAITLWVFRMTDGSYDRQQESLNASSQLFEKNIDQKSELATSKSVRSVRMGWQKLDITTTVRKWYAEGRHTPLRLLVDCSGCGQHVRVHLFAQPSSATHQRSRSYHVAAAAAAATVMVDANRPFLVIFTDANAMKRVRRRALDCHGDVRGQCCKEKFYVDFRELGWDDWIIAPHGYYANYCKGDCSGPRTPDKFQSYHSHVIEEYRKMDRLSGLQPCCAPLKFSSMSLIYFEENQKIVKRDLPKMVVDECGCP